MDTGDWVLGTGDWGLGTGDWGLGTGDWVLGTGDWGLGTGDWVLGEWREYFLSPSAPQPLCRFRLHSQLPTPICC